MNDQPRNPISLSVLTPQDGMGVPTEIWTDPTGELVEQLRRLGSDIGALRQELAALQERQGWTVTR